MSVLTRPIALRPLLCTRCSAQQGKRRRRGSPVHSRHFSLLSLLSARAIAALCFARVAFAAPPLWSSATRWSASQHGSSRDYATAAPPKHPQKPLLVWRPRSGRRWTPPCAIAHRRPPRRGSRPPSSSNSSSSSSSAPSGAPSPQAAASAKRDLARNGPAHAAAHPTGKTGRSVASAAMHARNLPTASPLLLLPLPHPEPSLRQPPAPR